MRELVQAWHGWPPPQRILRILHPSQARLVTFDREAGILADTKHHDHRLLYMFMTNYGPY
jgi:hypothetical protein